jgi:hypothetical protein
VIEIQELLVHWHSGRRIGELCSSLGVDPKTVRKYIAPAIAAGITPGGPSLSSSEWSTLVEGWFPALRDPSSRQTTWPEIEPHKALIGRWLGDVHVTTIHQRLRDDHGLVASESSLRRFIAANFAEEAARAAVRVLRETPAPGAEAQVDYGLLGRWLDPVSGRRRRIWGFISVLACSRLMFVQPVWKMDEFSWTESHVRAFEYFGGVTARVVPDNLKTGVVHPDLYDPLVNKSFGELAEHYGVLIDPARVVKPRDKARVERHVPYVRDSFFAGREDQFTSLSMMQAEAVRWCDEVANRRASRALGGLSPREVFEAEERAHLLALPQSRFELARWSSPKVGPDIHVKVGLALYSVPWRRIGEHLDARQGARTVEIYSKGMLIKTHVRIERGRQTDPNDYPPEKIAFFMRNPVWCRRRAAELGPWVAEVVETLMEVNALYRLRSAQGVIHLAEKFGADRLNAACRRATVAGDPSYRTVKGILLAGTENDDDLDSEVPPSAPAHLHGPEALFDVEAG